MIAELMLLTAFHTNNQNKISIELIPVDDQSNEVDIKLITNKIFLKYIKLT